MLHDAAMEFFLNKTSAIVNSSAVERLAEPACCENAVTVPASHDFELVQVPQGCCLSFGIGTSILGRIHQLRF